MSFALILDIVIAVMLVVTIGYSVVLYRRLGVLRRSHDDMEKVVRKFAHSIKEQRRNAPDSNRGFKSTNSSRACCRAAAD